MIIGLFPTEDRRTSNLQWQSEPSTLTRQLIENALDSQPRKTTSSSLRFSKPPQTSNRITKGIRTKKRTLLFNLKPPCSSRWRQPVIGQIFLISFTSAFIWSSLFDLVAFLHPHLPLYMVCKGTVLPDIKLAFKVVKRQFHNHGYWIGSFSISSLPSLLGSLELIAQLTQMPSSKLDAYGWTIEYPLLIMLNYLERRVPVLLPMSPLVHSIEKEYAQKRSKQTYLGN